MENQLHDVELDVARCIERLDHNDECLRLLKQNVLELTKSINALERTILVTFAEQRGRDLSARRYALALSTIISLVIASAGVAAAMIF